MERDGPAIALGGHVQEVADRVLGAGQRRGAAGDAHRDAGQRHLAGQFGEGVVLRSGDTGRPGEEAIATGPEEGHHLGIEGRVRADRRGEVPVGRGREHRHQLAEAGLVHRGRRPRDGLEVDDQGGRPVRRHGPLHAAPEQDGHVVGEGVDRDRCLDDHERQPRPEARVLRDVGHGPRAHAHHDTRAGDRGVGLGERALVGVELRAVRAQDDVTDRGVRGRRGRQPRHDQRLEVAPATDHLGRVGQDDRWPGSVSGTGGADFGHGLGQQVQCVRVDLDATQPDLPARRPARTGRQARPQRDEVGRVEGRERGGHAGPPRPSSSGARASNSAR